MKPGPDYAALHDFVQGIAKMDDQGDDAIDPGMAYHLIHEARKVMAPKVVDPKPLSLLLREKSAEVDKLRMSLLFEDLADKVDDINDGDSLTNCEYLIAFGHLEIAQRVLKKAAILAQREGKA